MPDRRNLSSDSSGSGGSIALVAAAGALAAISSVGLLLVYTSRERRTRAAFQDSKELYIPNRFEELMTGVAFSLSLSFSLSLPLALA